jgi:hypothetical protein
MRGFLMGLLLQLILVFLLGLGLITLVVVCWWKFSKGFEEYFLPAFFGTCVIPIYLYLFINYNKVKEFFDERRKWKQDKQ